MSLYCKVNYRLMTNRGDPENVQGVVNSIVSNSSSDISDDDLSDSDYPDKAVEIRSLINYEFTSGQYNSPSVRGRLSLCYDQWVKLGALGFKVQYPSCILISI